MGIGDHHCGLSQSSQVADEKFPLGNIDGEKHQQLVNSFTFTFSASWVKLGSLETLLKRQTFFSYFSHISKFQQFLRWVSASHCPSDRKSGQAVMLKSPLANTSRKARPASPPCPPTNPPISPLTHLLAPSPRFPLPGQLPHIFFISMNNAEFQCAPLNLA